MPFATLREGNMFYREKGSGRVAFFVHAYILDSTLWLDQLHGLSANRRCIAPDLLNHGQSDPLTETTVDPVRDAKRLLEFLEVMDINEPMDIVGLSAGGIIAALMYEMKPEIASTITFISTGFVIGATAEVMTYQREMARIAVVESKDALFRRFDEYIVSSGATLHARARYKSMLCNNRYETLVALLTSEALVARPELPAKIKVPVFMPYGDEDIVMTQDTIGKLLAQYNDAEVTAVEKAGRLLPLENAEGTNKAIIDFWKKRSN